MSKNKAKKGSAPKAKFSFRRHILPPLAGLLVMAGVFIILDSQVLIAKFNYHFQKPVAQAAPVISTKSPAGVTSPRLTIPEISVDAPIQFNDNNVEWAVQLALREGVDHYGGTALPGQIGNTVIVGHSSGALWAPGDYKFVFTLLDKIKPGDQIIIDYKGTRYTYKVSGTEIIMPSNLSVLNQNTQKPSLTLITCTPVGTSKNRFVVHADQISPAPTTAAQPAQSQTQVKAQPLLPDSDHASLWKSVTGWL